MPPKKSSTTTDQKKTTRTSKKKVEEQIIENQEQVIISTIETPLPEVEIPINVIENKESITIKVQETDKNRIDIEKYEELDKNELEKYSNLDLLSILFVRFRKGGNPLLRQVLEIYKTTLDPLRKPSYRKNNNNHDHYNVEKKGEYNEIRRKPSKYGKYSNMRDRTKYDKEFRKTRKEYNNNIENRTITTEDAFNKFINE